MKSIFEQMGQHTTAVVRLFLAANKVEQQGYKSCMALLKLADRYSPQRLENACWTVSYTHLDVYKRQMVQMARAHNLNVERYLTFLLESRPTMAMSDAEPERLLPWGQQAQSFCSSGFAQ